MFIDCPYCGFLVALGDDGKPLPRCPNCAQRLREDDAQGETRDAAADAATQEDATVSASATPTSASTVADRRDDDAAAAPIQAEAAPIDTTDTTPPDATGMPAGATTQPPREAEVTTPPDAAPAQPAPAADDAASAFAVVQQEADAAPEPDTPPEAACANTAAIDVPAGAEPANAEAAATSTAADIATDADADARPAAATRKRSARTTAVPSFARPVAVAPADRGRLKWELAAIAALGLLLALQLLLSQRARLAADAQWRPLLSTLCAALRCTLPPWREPEAFRVLERDVRAQAPGVLRVSARIRNDARWAQPWPALRLTLSDADGRAVASRLFQPREYLGGAPTQTQLGSGQSVALRMDLVEPGPQAVAFTFDFQ